MQSKYTLAAIDANAWIISCCKIFLRAKQPVIAHRQHGKKEKRQRIMSDVIERPKKQQACSSPS